MYIIHDILNCLMEQKYQLNLNILTKSEEQKVQTFS